MKIEAVHRDESYSFMKDEWRVIVEVSGVRGIGEPTLLDFRCAPSHYRTYTPEAAWNICGAHKYRWGVLSKADQRRVIAAVLEAVGDNAQ